jgi:hypothetical protein
MGGQFGAAEKIPPSLDGAMDALVGGVMNRISCLGPLFAIVLAGCAGAEGRDVAAPEAPVAPPATTPVLGAGPVTVDAVTSALDDVAAEDIVRDALQRELAAMDWDSLNVSAKYQMSAKVVRLHTEVVPSSGTGSKAVATCTVSTVLLHERAGVVALLEGSAQAEDAPDAADRATRSAIDAAARGSLTGLRAAIRSTN